MAGISLALPVFYC